MTIRIDQFHTTVSDGASIGGQILNLQQMLRGLGYQSEIFCEQPPLHFSGQTRQMREYNQLASAKDVLLAHFSLNYSHAVVDWLKTLPSRKVMIYHNITPPHYFVGVNDIFLEAAQMGQQQLGEMVDLFEAGWGDSIFNAQDLAAHGWTRSGVLPIIFNPDRLNARRPDQKILKRWHGGVNVLFVGRVSPNKRFEDVILTFYDLKRFVCPEARLCLVGSAGGMERYLDFLQTLVERLGLTDVIFTGHIGASQCLAYYQCASVYVSMSEHEGFGIPFLESMHFGLPIIAYKAAAIPETLADSGLLVTQKNYAAIAELIGLLIEDEALRAKIVTRQRERLQDFLPSKIENQLRQLLYNLDVL